MPKIVYVGKKTTLLGKPLWEIIGNLKDYGVGRLVYRHLLERYPEPSFDKIVKVETVAIPNDGKHSIRRVVAWVERVFRGKRHPRLVELFSASYKSDYRLVPKDEEELWYKRMENVKEEVRIYDPYIQLPPLLGLILKQERKAKGEPVEDVMKTSVIMNMKPNNRARLAREGETPTHHFVYGFGKPASPSLFENIEASRPYFENRNPWLDQRDGVMNIVERKSKRID